MPPTAEQLAELEAKHKHVACINARWEEDGVPVWSVVLRRPTRGEYKRLRAEMNDESRKADATERLFRQICVMPSGDAIDALLEEWPAIPEACSETILKLLGAAGTADAK